MSTTEFYDAVGKHVKEKMPQEFGGVGKLPTNRGSAPGSQGGGRKAQSVSYANLNQDQKNVCRELVNSGIFTQEEYVKQLDEMGEIDKG